MSCNCKGGRQERRRFSPTTASVKPHALVMPDGSRAVYGSKLEAEAANVRAKYRGRVMPA